MAISAVGGGTAAGSSTTSLTTTGWASVAGNVIAVFIHAVGALGTNVFTVTDNLGSVWTDIRTAGTNASGNTTDGWITNNAVGTGTRTVKVTTPSAQTFVVCAEEYSGAVFDTINSVGSEGSSNSASVFAPIQTGAADWVVGGLGGGGNATFTMDVGMTQRQTNNASSSERGDEFDYVGNANKTITLSKSEGWTNVTLRLMLARLAPSRNLMGVGF